MTRSPSLEAVLFDVDGTLVDSERHGHRVAFNLAFQTVGLPDRWDEQLYGELLKVTGGKERVHHYLRSRGGEDPRRGQLVDRIHEAKNAYFLDLVEQGAIAARDGVARLIDELGHTAIRLGVVTTGSQGWVDAIVDQHFGRHRFEIFVTGEDVSKKKPDPSAYEVALDRLGIAASAVLAVEDSVPGLGAAKAAGLPCVVVVNDYTRDEDFTSADLVLDGYGTADRAATVLSNPHSVGFDGWLDAGTLRAVHAAFSDLRT